MVTKSQMCLSYEIFLDAYGHIFAKLMGRCMGEVHPDILKKSQRIWPSYCQIMTLMCR